MVATLPLKLFSWRLFLVENMKLVFVPRNGCEKVASAERACWFPRSDERHLLHRPGIFLAVTGLKDPGGGAHTHDDAECRATCRE